MKLRYEIKVMFYGLALMGLLCSSHASADQNANVIYVHADSTGASDGTNWGDAYNDLQVALTMAAAGDEIWVASGTYRPAGPDGDRSETFQLLSDVAIYGGFSGTETEREQRQPALNPTILSGDLNANDSMVPEAADLANDAWRMDNSYHVVTGTGTHETAILDGFVITGGYATGVGSESNGGGMINRGGQPTLIDCSFEWNFAAYNGGGIYNDKGDFTLIDCTFRENHSRAKGWDGAGTSPPGVGGGGMYSRDASPYLCGCRFTRNTTDGQGAGMVSYRSPSTTIVQCAFENNRQIGTGLRHGGGGLWLREGGTAVITNSAFWGNSAHEGGAIANIHDPAMTIINTVFSGNLAADGAGIFAVATTEIVKLVNCTFNGNRSQFSHGFCLSHGSSSPLILRNCIFWDNFAGEVSDRTTQIQPAGQRDVSHSCIQGGWDDGIGNIGLYPRFLDADGPDDIFGTADDDLRLALDSPCIDAGDSAALPLDIEDLNGNGDTMELLSLDLNGNTRIWGSRIDMGAYEVGLATAAVNPVPTNGASDVFHDVVLSWEPGVLAQTHDVYFGAAKHAVQEASPTNPMGVLLSQGRTESLFDPGRLAFDQRYYWRIDEVNGSPDYTVHKGEVWHFTTERLSYPVTQIGVTASGSLDSQSLPEGTINGSGLTDGLHGTNVENMWVSDQIPAWIEYAFDRPYTLQEMVVWNANQITESSQGFGAKEVVIEYSVDGIDWTILEAVMELAQGPGTDGYATKNRIDFAGAFAQFVRITINSVYGIATQTGLSEVQFSYIPVFARIPQPADGDTTDSLDVVLSWTPGRGSELHEVLFSENREDIESGGALVATTVEPNFDLGVHDFKYGRVYYWQVNEINDLTTPAIHFGDIWQFAPPEFMTVDDMEGYYNRQGFELRTHWEDGTYDPANGAVVGDDSGKAETELVLEGNQSMPLAYDNREAAVSEVRRTFDPPLDWVRGDPQVLSLYFLADPTTFRNRLSNDAAPLYLVIRDSAGRSVQVDYPDLAATHITAWTEWVIPIDDLAALDLSSIESVTIGIGGDSNMSKGRMYFDNIRVGTPLPQVP